MDNFYYDDINMRLSIYILSRQKGISGLLKNRVSKVINPGDMSVNIQVLNHNMLM